MESTRPVAVVTGAAQGIGAAVAARFAAENHRVVLLDRDEELLRDTADRLAAAGGDVDVVPVDLARPAAIDAAFETIAERHGRLDAMVNNAGVTRDIDFFALSPEDWDWIYDINARGTFLCTQAAATLMRGRSEPATRRARRGAIVNIASIAGKGWTNTSNIAYASSKGSVVIMTRIAASVLAGDNITVNAVCPGVTLTPLVAGLVRHRGVERGRSADEALAELNATIPLGRANEPDDVAAAVLFLCSPAARNITGQSLNVDGGLMWD